MANTVAEYIVGAAMYIAQNNNVKGITNLDADIVKWGNAGARGYGHKKAPF